MGVVAGVAWEEELDGSSGRNEEVAKLVVFLSL